MVVPLGIDKAVDAGKLVSGRLPQRRPPCTATSRQPLWCTAGGAPASEALPPYRQLSMPVYSLSTNATCAGRRATMNIVTYASPVALQPPVYAVGLYKGTQSWENFRDSGRGLLQILRRQHVELLQLLGKTSARDVDKMKGIEAAGFGLVDRLGYCSLADCAGVMELTLMADLVDAGDHEVALCSVGRTQDVDGAGEVLYTDFLRACGHV